MSAASGGEGSAVFRPNRPAVVVCKLPGFLFVGRPHPAMYGLGWTLGGVYGTAAWCSVGAWCGCVWCVSIPNFDGPFLLQMIVFREKKKTSLVAGSIRPNPSSFSKSIGAFLPKKLYTEAAGNEFFRPFLRCTLSAKKKLSWVAVSS